MRKSWALAAALSAVVSACGSPGLEIEPTQPLPTIVEGVTISNTSPITVSELDTIDLTMIVSASEPDPLTLTLSATNLPAGATFNANGPIGAFKWTPGATGAGVYTIPITVTAP